jgi:hypothetical protein
MVPRHVWKSADFGSLNLSGAWRSIVPPTVKLAGGRVLHWGSVGPAAQKAKIYFSFWHSSLFKTWVLKRCIRFIQV